MWRNKCNPNTPFKRFKLYRPLLALLAVKDNIRPVDGTEIAEIYVCSQ
jgi:hypothetical protein